MPKLISRYPDGLTGLALLLMRLSCALITFPAFVRLSPAPAGWWPVAIVPAAVALALVAGLGTRAIALATALALVLAAFSARGEAILLLLAPAATGIALALLGPGAWSVDAHRFGRRVIRVEPRSPDRGSPG